MLNDELHRCPSEEFIIHKVADRQIQATFRRCHRQQPAIEIVLPKRQFEIMDRGRAEKTFDFDDDFLPFAFGGNSRAPSF